MMALNRPLSSDPLEHTIPEMASAALLQESQALARLAHKLPSDFQDVVTCLSQIQGKVVFSGVGKSGYIARKIASTLSSTGTAACFLHPTEASHGDLGFLTADDALVLFSNSGETAELAPLIQYAHRFHIPLIAMTSDPRSTLGEASRWVLVLPQEPEVCALGLAPTTSALLMLGLGDALTVCLLHLKNFQDNDYHARHPGGALGLKLLRVSDMMRKGIHLPLVTPEKEMSDALLIMTEKACGCLGVVAKEPSLETSQKLMGIITDGDLRRHMSATLLKQSVRDIMTPEPLTIAEEMLAADALTFMNKRRVTVLFVHDQAHNVTGLIHLHDCLKMKIY